MLFKRQHTQCIKMLKAFWTDSTAAWVDMSINVIYDIYWHTRDWLTCCHPPGPWRRPAFARPFVTINSLTFIGRIYYLPGRWILILSGWINERMNECMNERKSERWMNWWMDGWMKELMDEWIDEWMDGHIDEEDEWMNEWKSESMNIWHLLTCLLMQSCCLSKTLWTFWCIGCSAFWKA